MTEECKSLVDRWVEAAQFSDDELADRIQADGVDILVDLSGHTAGNRLTVFARKPAPIQVTAWGAGTGTGLQTMDYFFADPVTIPETVRPLFAEKVYDLPCVITTEALPDVQPSPLPMIRNGHVTFGVFNRIDKISDGALAVWSKLLQEVAGSTIVIKNTADQFLRDGLIGRFVAQGVSPDRIRCIGRRHALNILPSSRTSTFRSIRFRSMAASVPGNRCRRAFPSSPSSAAGRRPASAAPS